MFAAALRQSAASIYPSICLSTMVTNLYDGQFINEEAICLIRCRFLLLRGQSGCGQKCIKNTPKCVFGPCVFKHERKPIPFDRIILRTGGKNRQFVALVVFFEHFRFFQKCRNMF